MEGQVLNTKTRPRVGQRPDVRASGPTVKRRDSDEIRGPQATQFRVVDVVADDQDARTLVEVKGTIGNEGAHDGPAGKVVGLNRPTTEQRENVADDQGLSLCRDGTE